LILSTERQTANGPVGGMRARSRNAEFGTCLLEDLCFMRSYRRCACFGRNVLLALLERGQEFSSSDVACHVTLRLGVIHATQG
jgi:hypothetical protein